MLAAAAGHVKVAQLLLGLRLKSLQIFEHLDRESDFGQTALQIAEDYGHSEMVEFLTKEGAGRLPDACARVCTLHPLFF